MKSYHNYNYEGKHGVIEYLLDGPMIAIQMSGDDVVLGVQWL
jgi:hypothetical protein